MYAPARRNLDRFEPAIRFVRELFEDLWFDFTRNVRTSGNVTLAAAGLRAEDQKDSELYQPARPRHIRQALRAMPCTDPTTYTFIDLGSGKGRSLFVAAEWPFREIVGVEFSPLLAAQAARNVRTFRGASARSKNIRSLHLDAMDFAFPPGNLVLYLFNPFGRETMRVVLDHLEQALRHEPRRVIVVLLWPRCEDMVAAIPGMRLTRNVKEYQIFSREASSAFDPL